MFILMEDHLSLFAFTQVTPFLADLPPVPLTCTVVKSTEKGDNITDRIYFSLKGDAMNLTVG